MQAISLPDSALQNGDTAQLPPLTRREQNILSYIVLCFYISQKLINMYFLYSHSWPVLSAWRYGSCAGALTV